MTMLCQRYRANHSASDPLGNLEGDMILPSRVESEKVGRDSPLGAAGRRAFRPTVPGCPRGDRAARRALEPRGLPGPVDARRQPGEMAPGAHDLVLRDIRAGRRLRRAIEPFHPAFGYLFNSYYNAVGDRWPVAGAG